MEVDKIPPVLKRPVALLLAFKQTLGAAWLDQNLKGHEHLVAVIYEDSPSIMIGPFDEILPLLKQRGVRIDVGSDVLVTPSSNHMWVMFNMVTGQRGWVLIDRTGEMN